MKAMHLAAAGIGIILLAGCSGGRQDSQNAPHLNGLGLNLAQAAEQSGDYQLADNVYASASESAPRDGEVQLHYADSLIRQGNVDGARKVLVSHMNTVSDARPLHGGLGLIYIMEGQPAQAIREFDAMGTAGEARWDVNRGVALDMLGRHAEAQALYRKVLAGNPGDSGATSDLALSLALSGHVSEASGVAAPLANDPSPRVKANFDVIQAAQGNAQPGTDGQVMQMAKAIDQHR